MLHAFGVLLLFAAPAGAGLSAPRPQPVVFSQPAAGATLHEGDIVDIRWSGVPADADEVELLLSVDGGQKFSLRLTEELDAASGSWLWRVPGLVADNAVLAIRMGVDGEEITSAPGPLFHLSPGLTGAGAALRLRGEEIWVDSGERAETAGPGAPTSAGLCAEPARIASVPDDTDAVDLPRPRSSRAGRTARQSPNRSLRVAEGGLRGTLSTVSSSRVPLSIPQRI